MRDPPALQGRVDPIFRNQQLQILATSVHDINPASPDIEYTINYHRPLIPRALVYKS